MTEPIKVAPPPPAPVESPATVAGGMATVTTPAPVPTVKPVETKGAENVTVKIPAAVAAPASRISFTLFELAWRLL